MTTSLAVMVARAPRTTVTGTWYRHTSLRVTTIAGSLAGGRWGPRGAFPVLYLGRPGDSVIVEAYRHLVDSVEGMRSDLVAPRRLFTCDTSVDNVIDLRTAEARKLVGLKDSALLSEVGDYEACQAVARAGHQLGVRGIVAPAATGLGETLALFTTHLPASQMPQIQASAVWDRLPDDPRRLRSVKDNVS